MEWTQGENLKSLNFGNKVAWLDKVAFLPAAQDRSTSLPYRLELSRATLTTWEMKEITALSCMKLSEWRTELKNCYQKPDDVCVCIFLHMHTYLHPYIIFPSNCVIISCPLMKFFFVLHTQTKSIGCWEDFEKVVCIGFPCYCF